MRQILSVVVALIVIVGAALFVVGWGDDDETADATTTSTSTSTSSTTTSTTTTTIPTDCIAPAEEPVPETTADATTTAPPTDDTVFDVGRQSSLSRRSSVSTVGLDEVNFGLTVRAAEEAAGTDMVPCEPVSDCYRGVPADAPEGISFVVTEGTIERVDIASGPIETVSGLGIGTAEAAILERFGDQIERELIDDATEELIFVPLSEKDAQFRVIFTMRDGVVETFRSGRLPIVLDRTPCA